MVRIRLPALLLAVVSMAGVTVTSCSSETGVQANGSAAPKSPASLASSVTSSSGSSSLSSMLGLTTLTTAASRLERCHTSQMSVSFRPGEPGAGQRYATLVLTNHSQTTCLVYGYVGMQLLDAQRHPLPTNVMRNRTQPPRSVVLSPNQSASSTLHWTVVNGPGEPPNRQCEPTPKYVEVTPPDETDFLLMDWDGGYVCLHGQLDIGPLVPT